MTRDRLRADLVVVPQSYRGEQSYIVKDPQTHKYFRFRPVEVVVMQEFDGEKTTAAVAAALGEQGLPLSVAQVEGFARKLKQLGLLERSLAERSVLMLERLRAERRRRLKRTHYTGSLLRMRWSVGDPDQWFDRWLPRLRFCFTPAFLGVSVALFVVYFLVFFTHWDEISHAIAAMYHLSTYTMVTIVVLWCTLMTIVVIHELGHGFACKYFGGQVHEMGAMLIYFQPAFYCNVNDAWTFPELKARLWVTAAGSWIQLVAAGLAAIVWWAATPGTLISQVALFAVIIGGVTTILANANPLIPLDGYYALSDYLEIPNLRQRAFGYLAWLVKRRVLRLEVPPPAVDDREKKVFVIYGALALAYSTTILALVAGAFLGWAGRTLGALGVAVFLFAMWAALGGAIREWGRAAVTAVREHPALWRSARLWRRAGAAALAVFVIGLIVPWPITVHGAFRAGAPLELALAAPDSGVVAQVYAGEGQRAAPGAPLVRLRNLALERAELALRRLVDSLAAREAQARSVGHAAEQARLGAERRARAADLAGATARLAALTLRAPAAGIVVTPRLDETVGRRVGRGDTVARLVQPDSLELRIALEHAGVLLVRAGQPAALIAYADARATRSPVTSVAAAGAHGGGLEARVRVPATAAWRPGVTGEAKIVVRRSNVWGALWWAVRKWVRSDLLL